jgi:hypothetical protein
MNSVTNSNTYQGVSGQYEKLSNNPVTGSTTRKVSIDETLPLSSNSSYSNLGKRKVDSFIDGNPNKKIETRNSNDDDFLKVFSQVAEASKFRMRIEELEDLEKTQKLQIQKLTDKCDNLSNVVGQIVRAPSKSHGKNLTNEVFVDI